MGKKVRTRYAPSPTGYMHIGNAKNALNQYLMAKSGGGEMVLRIEDTDRKREVPGAVEIIYNTLKILGIKYDEGPDLGGPCGPYVQSQRMEIYMEKALELVNKKAAYYCFCSRERLETLALEGDDEESELKDVIKYDRRCMTLADDEIKGNIAKNLPFVIRQIIPAGSTTIHDELLGDITIDNSELDDQILMKSDGFPTYNFANVVDDYLMGITHVIRDQRYLSSAPKYDLLYAAFGWPVPIYAHNALLCSEDGKVYAKRRGAQSIDALIEKGYLPEAIVNFIALLGWSPENNQEFFTMEELEQSFSISRMSKSPSIVDMRKLQWMNGEYFKRMDFDKFYQMAKPVIDQALANAPRAFDTEKLALAIQSRLTFLSDIPDMLNFLPALPDYSMDLYENKKQKCDAATGLAALEKAQAVLAEIPDSNWQNDSLYAALQETAAQNNMKNSQILWPVRVALSGKASTPVGATELLELLGKEESLVRIDDGIGKLRFS